MSERFLIKFVGKRFFTC